MEKIKQFEKALESLEKVLEMEYSDVIRDSVIKRFAKDNLKCHPELVSGSYTV